MRTSSTRRRPPSAAPPRCCWRSTRSGWSVAAAARTAFALGQYVNDRPVRRVVVPRRRVRHVFGTAIAGRCKDAAGAGRAPLPLGSSSRRCPAAAARRWSPAVRAAGLEVDAHRPARPEFPDWGESRYLSVTLTGELRLADAAAPPLRPAARARRRQALLGRPRRGREARSGAGEGWLHGAPGARADLPPLPEAPARALAACAGRLARGGRRPTDETRATRRRRGAEPLAPARGRPSWRRSGRGAAGCSISAAAPGRCSAAARDGRSPKSSASTCPHRALRVAQRRLQIDRPSGSDARIRLFQGPLTYRDERLAGFDAAALIEVIEHVDPPRLEAFERERFRSAPPSPWWSRRRTPSTTCSSSRCRPARCGTATTGSSGPGRNSTTGRTASRSATATRVRFLPVGPRRPARSGRRPRWRSSSR